MADMPPEPPQEPPPAGEKPSKLRAWLQLLRIPNLFTVPGDPIAGMLLAGSTGLTTSRPMVRLAFAAAISVLIYSAGLIWNDIFDLPEDRLHRPDRPLPSGRIRPIAAAALANILLLAAIGLAAIAGKTMLYVTMAVAGLALSYDTFLKRIAVLGPLAMGTCRGLSVLLGAAALGPEGLVSPPALAAAGGVTAYIAAVTFLASGETHPTAVRAKAMLIITMAAAWMLGLILTIAPANAPARWAMTAMAALTIAWIAWRLGKLGGDPPPPEAVQAAVGGLIRGLILGQAAAIICLGWTPAAFAAGLLACFAANALLARRFYAS